MPTEQYYYQSELTEDRYSSIPSNMLSVPRMVQHKPFWRQAVGSILMKKKVLVINDSTIANWGAEECIVAAERFAALQDNGFKIYIYLDECFLTLDTTFFNKPKELVNEKPVTDKRIIEKAAQELHLSHDEIWVLNHEELSKLIQGIDEEWLNLTSFGQVNLQCSNINIASLTELLKRSGNQIKSLNLSGCVNLKGGTLTEMFALDGLEKLWIEQHDSYKQIPALNTSLRRLNNLNASSIEHLVKCAPNIKTLSLKESDIGNKLTTNLNFPCLEWLDLSSSNIHSQSLAKILAGTQALKVLKLAHCNNIGTILTINLSLSSLEWLDLSWSHINSQSLNNMLVRAQKLKVLDLSKCEKFESTLTTKLNLACLEVLHSENSNINSPSLGNLLAGSQKLRTLQLKHCKNLGDELTTDLNLPCLEELDAQWSNIKIQSLARMLARAQKLKKLSLVYCKKLGDELTTDLNLPCLEDLDLSLSTINSQSLNKMLARVQKLKKLNLSYCHHLEDTIIVNSNFVCLEVLLLSQSNISSESLAMILVEAQGLKVLDVSDCWNLDDTFATDLNLPCLEELRLSCPNMSGQALGNMLARMQKLKKLNLTGSQNLDDMWDADLNFDRLEEIALNDTNINGESLGGMLAKAKKLKKLFALRCENLDDELPTNLNLPCLEELNLALSNMNSQSLAKILAGSSALKILNLHGCENLDETFITHLNLACLQQLNLTGCRINPERIKQLQSQAPHLKIIFEQPQPASSSVLTVSATPGEATQTPPPDERSSLDANTQFDPNKRFVLNRLFYASDGNEHPEPTSYRQQVYNHFESNKERCSAQDAFVLTNASTDRVIKACVVSQSTTDLKATLSTLPDASQCYYGIQSLELGQQWLPLASLSAEEEMTQYHLSPATDIEIGYSQRDNLYCIRRKPGSLPNKGPITIDFIVKVPPPSQQALPLDIQDKINECLNFGRAPLKTSPDACGDDYLDALQTQKVGACRHRSLVFKAWMSQRKPSLPTRIVNNGCHSFVEVYYKGRWISCNLGGYPAKLEIYEQNSKTPVIQHLKMEHDSSPLVPEKNYFLKETVKQNTPAHPSAYMQQLLSYPGHKKLIQVPNEQTLNGLRYHLQTHCHNTARPCFYIHAPEDLICAAPYIQRTGSTGTLKRGPGGPLHEFLMQHSKDGSQPLLIVNYDQFRSEDIVRFNTLLDKVRYADGSPLPNAAQVIGLMNPGKPQAYDGADFLSRFDAIIPHTLSTMHLDIPSITVPSNTLPKETKRINLYEGKDWEERLLGHWVLKGHQLHFVEGELLLALNNKKTAIELSNAPWSDGAFQAFWQKALLCGVFTVYGTEYRLPKDFKLSDSNGYSFAQTSSHLKVNVKEHIPGDALVLNRTLLGRFFNQYHCTNHNASIHYDEGILQKNANQLLNVYLSDTLDLPSWALFLDTCQQHKVQVNLTLAPGVTLPKELGIICPLKAAASPIPWPPTSLPATAYIQSTDQDVTLKQLPENAVIIDVSEVTSAELLLKLDARFDEKNLAFYFNEYEGALLKALKDNKTVILTGTIKEELRHAFSEFLLKRQQEATPKGQVLILSDLPHSFPMLPSYRHQVSVAEKQQRLTHHFPAELYSKHSLVTLQAMQRHLALHPHDSGVNAWMGMTTLPPIPKATAIDLKNSEQAVTEFNQQRLTAVEQGLKQAPFVMLAGITGVGKTTFIHEVWKQKHAKLYLGEASKSAWANDRTPGIKTLFIDEANISSRHWSEFEGLFHNPPRILINNEVIELTQDHKVIFAGNPLAYGGERQMPSLFARHGNSVLFNPLPPACMYQKSLKPIFTSAQLDSESLAHVILAVAEFCNHLEGQQLLITPREQEMMALLTVSYCHKNPLADALKVAQYYAYTLAESFVPEEHKPAFALRFKNVVSLTRPSHNMSGELLINTNNQPALDALRDLLDLRKLRQSRLIKAEGGLGGLILEGEPGVGKTELVVNTLIAYGLKKGALDKEHVNESVFYVVPVSMSFEEKKAVLLKAFHEGAPVVMDEINSAPMMERLLNDLLMGKDPQGHGAQKPGFLLLGTQNPPTMAGRKRFSTALKHRMQQDIISEYSPVQMINILTAKGLPGKISDAMVAEYLHVRRQAINESSTPLCFRDLVRCAEHELERLSEQPLLTPYIKLLDNLKRKQQDYSAHSPQAFEQAGHLIRQLMNKAIAFYHEANFTREAADVFKTECIKTIEQNSAILKEHRTFAGAFFAAIHQFFIALRAYLCHAPTMHRFFDSRSNGAKVVDELTLNMVNFSMK